MSNRASRESRRGLFAPHASDRLKLRRCPICQWAVEQDHAEAFAMHSVRLPEASHPGARLAPERDAHEELVAVGFALV